MYHDIRLPDELYKRLEKHAQGFDTPINVIERILNHFEGVEATPETERPKKRLIIAGQKDLTKYSFKNKVYGKSRLVLAVIKEACSVHQNVTFEELEQVFPQRLQGASGVFATYDDAMEVYARTGHKRHFLKDEDVIKLRDGTVIAVSNQWGSGNIDNFLIEARQNGYEITPV